MYVCPCACVHGWQELQKHEDWEWIEWASESFPTPLFTALHNIRAEGFDPFAEP